MSLKTTIQRSARRALRIADSLAVDATYVSAGAQSYDPTTGVQTVAESTTTFRVFLVAVKQSEVDGTKVQLEDKKAIFDRQGFPFAPKTEDLIRIGGTGEDAGDWEVVGTLREPSESIYILQVRRP